MQPEFDFFRESSTMIATIIRAPISRRLLKQNDIDSISYTIFEQDSPQSNISSPVPYFENVTLDKTKVVWDLLQDGELENRFGIRPIQFNFAFILAPQTIIVGGNTTKIFPFPVVGKCYRVLFRFISANPDFPDFVVQVVGYAV